MKEIWRSEQGFTFIEAIVAAAIVAVLAILAVQAWIVYREQAYYRLSEQMMQQTRTALEAGKVYDESFPASLLTYEQLNSGPVSGAVGEMLLPGLVLPDDFRVYANHDPTCTTDVCQEDYIIARHCKSNQRVIFTRWHGLGESLILNAAATGTCTT